MIPPPSALVWRDYATDPPNPPNGIFLVIRKPMQCFADEGQFPVEAQHWKGCGEMVEGWYESDSGWEIHENDILYWAELPEVFIKDPY